MICPHCQQDTEIVPANTLVIVNGEPQRIDHEEKIGGTLDYSGILNSEHYMHVIPVICVAPKEARHAKNQ